MEKEIFIEKVNIFSLELHIFNFQSTNSSTGFVFTGFKSI